MPSHGPRGTLAAGASTTKVTLSTALPASVGVNQLANRGDGVGYKIRIIGNTAGGSGKIEERTIIANTGGATPTLTLNLALSFTPASGDAYEILSGRVYLLSAGTTAAGIWKYYDIATNSYSGNLATTNLPATIGTDTDFVGLDEQYVPHDKSPGQGFLGQLTATGAAAGTLTGQAAGGDAGVLANEYRNFMVRIVEDTGTPTAVGQRRLISSHTAGPSAVYSITPNWTVTPSATAKFVIENIGTTLGFSSATGNVYEYTAYAIGARSADSWSTATFAARGANMGAGCVSAQNFGIVPDADKTCRHSYIFSFRGGNVNTLDLLDIAGGATGVWTTGLAYGGQSANTLFTTATCGVYAPATQSGKYLYLNHNATQRSLRFDLVNRVLEPMAYLRYAQGTAYVGMRLGLSLFVDGSTKMSLLHLAASNQANLYQLAIPR
jgi:hypothetical protein